MKIVDMEFDLPADEEGNPRHPDMVMLSDEQRRVSEGPFRLGHRPGYGFENYTTVFRTQNVTEKPRATLESYVAKAREAGVVKALVRGVSNEQTASLVQEYPDMFMGLAFIHPLDGMRGVFELERLVREEGLSALAVSAIYGGLAASDARLYPLYAKCVELNIPVRIYSAMSYANDRPYDLGHPRHIDRVAIDFPELRIVAGLGGWPWAGEMSAILRRHPLVYADTSAHRPKYFKVPGSGWEQFLAQGNNINQSKIMVGLSAQLVGGDFGTLVNEYEELPLKDSVKQKWFYENAAEFFGLD